MAAHVLPNAPAVRLAGRLTARLAVLAALLWPIAVCARQGPPATPEDLARVTAVGLETLATWARGTGIVADFRVMRVTVDGVGTAHVRVQQYYQDIPVFGGEAIAHVGADGRPAVPTDGLVRGLKVDVVARVDRGDAVRTALAAAGRADQPPGGIPADLWVLRRDGADRLVYRVQVPMTADARLGKPVVFVDAHDGRVVWQFDDLQTGGLR